VDVLLKNILNIVLGETKVVLGIEVKVFLGLNEYM
jgi:hypothetical protein